MEEAVPAGGAAPGLGVKELFGQVKRGGEKPGGDGMTHFRNYRRPLADARGSETEA